MTDAARVLLDPHDAGLIAVVLDDQRLDVEHDVGDVLDHAGQRGEFVLGAVELDLRDRAAFQAGKQDAAKAVADGHAETRARTARRRTCRRWPSGTPCRTIT